MKIELPDKDILFIYGHFQKQLTELNKMETLPNCPLDKTSLKREKSLYLSIIEKLAEQAPKLKQTFKNI